MESMATLFANFSTTFTPVGKTLNKRNELIKELYELYLSQPEKTQEENRRRYYEYVRLHHPEVLQKIGFSEERYNSHKPEFKTAKLPTINKFLKPLSERYFAIKLAHIKGDEGLETLRYMISIAKDKLHREENVAAYILGSIKIH